MRAVAIQARRRSVHGHGRDRPLWSLMAAPALARLEGRECSRIGCQSSVARGLVGEGVAIHAIGVCARTKALLRRARRVFDGGLGGVAGCAALGRDCSHARCAELMTGIAGDPLRLDVHRMPRDAPILAPRGSDVDPSTG